MIATFILASDEETHDMTMECFNDGDTIHVVGGPDFGKESFTKADTVIAAFNAARESALHFMSGMVIIRSGSVFLREDLSKLKKSIESRGIVSATIIDPADSNIEYTGKVESGFPIPRFTKTPRKAGITESWWTDGPVIGFSYEALLSIGEFDAAVQEQFFMIDYSLRARWLQHEVSINHDAPVKFLNKKPFSSVFKGRDAELFALGQHNFTRKWGGSMMMTLKG